MDQQTLWIVAVLSAGTLFGAFLRMRGGFGPMNLRAIGIVLIAALASLLAIGKSENLTAAMGILGAIAGYLFGAKSSESEDAAASATTGVNAQGAKISGNSKVAGRDINETVNNIEKMLGDVKSLANATVQNLQMLSDDTRRPVLKRRRQESIRWECEDASFLRRIEELSNSRFNNWMSDWIDLCLEHPECLRAIGDLVQSNSHSGWQAVGVNFDNIKDGLYVEIIFEREIKIPGF